MSAPRVTTDSVLVVFGLVMVAALGWFVSSLFELAATVIR